MCGRKIKNTAFSLIISTNILTRGEYRVHNILMGDIKVATLLCQYEAPLAAKSGFSLSSNHSFLASIASFFLLLSIS